MSLRPTPATSETHGPFRKVTGTAERGYAAYPLAAGGIMPERRWMVETLECGHDGDIVSGVTFHFVKRSASRRRCWRCGTVIA